MYSKDANVFGSVRYILMCVQSPALTLKLISVFIFNNQAYQELTWPVSSKYKAQLQW